MPSKYTVTPKVRAAHKKSREKVKGKTGGNVRGTGRAAISRPVGRPTKYKPEYCQQVIEYGKEGLTKLEMACRLDVVQDVLYDWMERYTEFSTAMGKAMQLSESWWINKGRQGLHGDFNTGPYSIITNNMYGWTNNRTKQEVTTTITLESFLDSIAEDQKKG